MSSSAEPLNENFLLKEYGIRGLIVMLVIVGFALLIIILSKVNDWVKYRLPMTWQSRIKTSMKEIEQMFKQAKETKSNRERLILLEAITVSLNQLSKLIGPNELIRLTGIEIDKMEQEIVEMKTKSEKIVNKEQKEYEKFILARKSAIAQRELKKVVSESKLLNEQENENFESSKKPTYQIMSSLNETQGPIIFGGSK